MQKITPHLWYDSNAREAVGLYVSVFENSGITNITTIDGTPSGSADIISFVLCGQDFMAINAGPYFKFTPAVSFMVACDTTEEVDAIWSKLSKEGKALMELGSYPFSERYGWTEDRFGLSWQLINQKGMKQKITPDLLFTGSVCGKAEEAISFYASVFHDASIGNFSRYKKDEAPGMEGRLNYAPFMIEGQGFAAMDGYTPDGGQVFSFNEAISFLVNCDTQEEIDYYWEKLSAVPEAEQCGWLKDKFGISWQINPSVMRQMMTDGSKEKLARVTNAFLKMKKFDINELKKAYDG